MAHISEDKVLETGSGNTTVSFTLAGAVTGFRTFASQLVTNDTCFYSAFAVDANGNLTGAFENGLGTYSAVNTLTRTTIIESSNAGAAVTFTGTLWIGLTLLATKTAQFDNNHVMKITNATAEPVNPASGSVLYSEPVMTGLSKLFQKSEFGTEKMIQDSMAFGRVIKFQGGAGGINNDGCTPSTQVGTFSNNLISTGSAKNATQRSTLTSVATAGGLASFYSAQANSAPVWRGGANGEGGFLYIGRFSLQTLAAGNRGFFGIADVVAPPTNVDPLTTTTPGQIGIGFSNNTGNLTLVHNVSGTARTQVALGANFPINTTDLYELTLFCPPFTGGAAQSIQYRVNRYTTSPTIPAFTASGTLSANIPASTTLLHLKNYMTNNATAAAVAWNFHNVYIGSDT